jgi:hypothetical protein
MSGKKVVIILSLDIIGSHHELIGNPCGLENGQLANPGGSHQVTQPPFSAKLVHAVLASSLTKGSEIVVCAAANATSEHERR